MSIDTRGIQHCTTGQSSVFDGIQKVTESKIHNIAVMPNNNEDKYIKKTIIGAQKHIDLVVVIDDCSNDTTAEIAEALDALVVCHDVNRGYGDALETICNRARKLGAEQFIILDADGHHNPDDISKFLIPPQQKMDVLIGSHFSGSAKNSIPDTHACGVRFRKYSHGQ